jgi:hypothetical protein
LRMNRHHSGRPGDQREGKNRKDNDLLHDDLLNGD